MSKLPSELLMALSQRADDPASYVDMAEPASFRRHPPATDEQLREAEDRLGFPLPEGLRQVYREVANGGFGPGYGLLGVAGGAADDRGNTAEQVYAELSGPDPDDPSWSWRDRVLPFCYWGCVVYSCITPEGDVIGFDEGAWDDRPVPLEEWLRAWLAGTLQQPVAQ